MSSEEKLLKTENTAILHLNLVKKDEVNKTDMSISIQSVSINNADNISNNNTDDLTHINVINDVFSKKDNEENMDQTFDVCRNTDTTQDSSQIFQQMTENNLSNNVYNNIVQDTCINHQTVDKIMKIDNTEIIFSDDKKNKMSALSIIAQEYEDSESDEITEIDVKTENRHTMEIGKTPQVSQYYRSNTVESSSESSSEEEDNNDIVSTIYSSSSDDFEDDTSEANKHCNKKSERSSKPTTKTKQRKIKNELDILPPIEDLKISVPEVICDLLGEITSIVEQIVIVKPNPSTVILNLDTVLFVNRGRKALGKIFDVMGKVNEPFYSVRFNSSEHIQDNDIEIGMSVYFCPNRKDYTSLVFMHELRQLKDWELIDNGSDVEPPDFSDDEEEQAYYANLAQQKNNAIIATNIQDSNGKWQSNHPWNRNNNTSQNRQRKRSKKSTHASKFRRLEHPSGAYRFPCPQTAPPSNVSHLSHQINYDNSNNANQCHQNVRFPFNVPRGNMHPIYIPFISPPRLHPPYQFPINSSPGYPFRYINRFPQVQSQTQIHTNASLSPFPAQSLQFPPPPPPPPPSSSSSSSSFLPSSTNDTM